MLDFLGIDSFLDHFKTDIFPFLDNNVTFSAKYYPFGKLCSHWLEFSINRAEKFIQRHLLSLLLKQHHLCLNYL